MTIVGEAFIVIKPETRLFKQDAQAKVTKAAQGIAAQVEATLDETGLRQKVQAAAAAAGRGVEVEIPVVVRDAAGRLRGPDGRFVGGGGGGGIGGGGGGDDFGGDDAKRAAGNFNDLARKLVGVAAAGGIASAVLNLLKWPVIIGGAGAAAASLGALTAAAVALAGALGPLVGILGALPGALFAAGAAVGVVALAFRGVGDAVKAYADQQKNAAETARQTAAEQEAAARAVEAAADRVTNATESVQDAERRHARAQKDALRAQEDLNEARQQAVEDLEDLRLSVEGAALAEQRAALRLRQAHEARAALGADGSQVTGTDLSDANLDVAEAELALREAQERRADEEAELREAEQKGIENADKVVDAREAVVVAEENVQDALRGTQRAQEELADAVRDSARATEELGKVGEEAGQKFADAMDRLNEPARRFVERLISMEPILDRLQERASAGLFPGLEQALINLAPLADAVAGPIERIGKAIGDSAATLAGTLTARGEDVGALGDESAGLIGKMGTAIDNLLQAFLDIAVAASGMTQALADMIVDATVRFSAFVKKQRESGGLERFFADAEATLRRIMSILGGFGLGLFNIFAAASTEGRIYLEQLDGIAGRFAEITEAARESGALAAFFASMRPTVEAVGRLLGDAAVGVGQIIAELGPQMAPLIEQIRTDLLPNILELIETLTDPQFLESIIGLTSSFVEFLAAISEPNPLILLLIETLGGFLEIISFLLTDLGFLSDVLGIAATAITTLGTVAAVVKFVGFLSELKGLQAAIGLINGAAPAGGAAGAAAGAAGSGLLGTIGLMGGVVLAGVALGIGLHNMIEKYAPGINDFFEDVGYWIQEHVIEKLGDALAAIGDFFAEWDRMITIEDPGGSGKGFNPFDAFLGKIPGRAVGGPVEAFRPYRVNEGTGAAGILIPLVPGEVLTPSQQPAAATNGGVWGVNGDLVIHGATAEGSYATAMAVIEELRGEAFRQGVGP